MIDQWFLDLDGNRSGPYHTPEIMSLIAEGEVLPHHRISTQLKDQAWRSILEWRLDQAKLSNQAPAAENVVSGPQMVPEQREPVMETLASVVQSSSDTKLAPEMKLVLEPKVQTAPSPPAKTPRSSQSSAPTPTPTPAALSDHREDEKTAEISIPPLESERRVDSRGDRRAKRDPMAEMFDMLQNSKQKKDSKQNAVLQSDITIEADTTPKARTGNLAKSIGIGAGIVIVGFALGQLFQTTAPAPTQVSVPVPPASPPPLHSQAPSSRLSAPTEVVDRSTDKLTIRANVERHVEQTQNPSLNSGSRASNHSSNRALSADAVQNEKELEELKNLKKELQELKALKANPGDEGETDGDGFDGAESGMPIDSSGGIPQSAEPQTR